MRSTLALLFLLLIFAVSSAAHLEGHPLIDSFCAVAASTKQDSVKGRMLMLAGGIYTDLGMFDSSSKKLQAALQLSQVSANKLLEAEVLYKIGKNSYYQGLHSDALQTWQTALDLARVVNCNSLEISVRLSMANALADLGNYPIAMQIYMELLRNAEAAGDDKNAALCMCNIAIIFSQQDNNDKAIEYHFKADKHFEKTGQTLPRVRNLCNLATTYTDMQQYDKALDAYFRSLAISQKNGFSFDIASVYSGLSRVYKCQGKFSDAINSSNRSNHISRNLGNMDMVAVNLISIAEIYDKLTANLDLDLFNELFHGNKDLALISAHKNIDTAILIFRESGNAENLKQAYATLSKVEEHQGNYKAALYNYIKFKDLSDTLFNQERAKKLTESVMQYEFDKKEAATKRDQDKKYAVQKNIRNSIAVGLLGTMAFSVVVFRQHNKVKKEKDNVEKEKARSDELLLNILPTEIADELKEKGTSEAKLMDDVTVLFTDFKDFTELSQKMSPKELVAEINICFSAFDNIMSHHGVEKIKTVGDAYMAAGGLPTPNHTHAADVVRAAIDIQSFMHVLAATRRQEGKPYFEIRIGVHTGPVVAGIVGVKKFQYDIWGDTVNTASRMESSGEVGKVNISGTTYSIIKNQFPAQYRGRISAKGKGEIDMYFLI